MFRRDVVKYTFGGLIGVGTPESLLRSVQGQTAIPAAVQDAMSRSSCQLRSGTCTSYLLVRRLSGARIQCFRLGVESCRFSRQSAIAHKSARTMQCSSFGTFGSG